MLGKTSIQEGKYRHYLRYESPEWLVDLQDRIWGDWHLPRLLCWHEGVIRS